LGSHKIIVLGLCWLYVVLFPITGIAQIKFGILANSGSSVCLERWSGLRTYLEKELTEEVYILPLGFDVVEPVVAAGEIDYLLANPFFFITVREKYGVRAIASLMTARKDRALPQFGGVLFVRKASSIHRLQEIRGKDFMVVDFSSFGGCDMAYRLLLDSHIDPRNAPASFVEGITHENVVQAVANDLVDVGTVRTGILEKMAESGKIRMENFRIIHRINDDFPLVHSTRLYPEWPMVALPHISDKQVTVMRNALFAMKPSSSAAVQAGIAGWQEPESYSSVQEVILIIEQSLQ
jgi:ABC-type phosphate/phosphonate transport system substrate-binding protein